MVESAAMKKKRKKWVEIVGPIEVNNTEIGHSYVDDPQLLEGRKVEANMMHLTRDIKKQNIKLTFLIDSIKEGKAHTKFVGYELLPSLVKRLIRRNKAKIEDSFVVNTKDNVKVRIKHVTLANDKASAPKRAAIRKVIREYFAEVLKNYTYSESIKSLLNGFLQKGVRDYTKHVASFNCNIRVFELEK